MIRDNIKKGQKVIIKTVELRPNLLVDPQYLDNRTENIKGVITNPIKNHNGAWWIHHLHGIAPYWYHEFELYNSELEIEEDDDNDNLYEDD